MYTTLIFRICYFLPIFFWEILLNTGNDAIEPASSLVIQDLQFMVPLEHDVMGTPKSHGQRFDLMQFTHRLILEQVSICAWMTGIFRHQCEGG